MEVEKGQEGEGGSKERKQKERGGRKNAAIACDFCRRKRIRCLPAEEPNLPCKGCEAAKAECQFTHADKRKENIQDLRSKLSQFEQLFANLEGVAGLMTPPSSTLPSSGPAGTRSETTEEPTDEDIHVNKRRRTSSSANLESGYHSPPQTFFTSTSPPTVPTFPLSAPIPPMPPSRLQSLAGSSGETLIVDRLAVEEGEIRAYGPTSNQTLAVQNLDVREDVPHAVRDRSDSRLQPPSNYPHCATTRSSLLTAAACNIDAIPLGTDIRTVEHLINLYFTWHHPLFPITSCRLFLDHFRDRGRYCSPLLLNAMLALASHLSDWPLVRAIPGDATTTGSTFFARAKSLLEDELEKPSVTTVQALCLMAKYEAYHGRALKGGLYIVMCGRLVLDLGLHLDPTHLVQKGILPEDAAWMRARAFWGVWSVDKEFSALVGRPSAIRGVQITCPKPGYWAAEDLDWWASYRAGQIVPLVGDSARGIFQIAELATEMAGVHLRAMDQMYWRENKPLLEENTLALEHHMIATEHAMAALPRLDSANGDSVNPLVVTLHMVYNCHTIILNRPFLFAAGFKKSAIATQGSGLAVSPARARCFDSAREIVRLMEMIRDATPHGLRTTLNCHQHNLVTAAAILLLETTPRAVDSDKLRERSKLAKVDLRRIFAMLASMSDFRPAAKQALDNLKDLYATTETQSTLASMATANDPSTSSHAWIWTDPSEDLVAIGQAGAGGPSGYEAISVSHPLDFSDFDTFLAQQQSYLYPTLACSDLFDTNGFFHTQMMQSQPASPHNGSNEEGH